MILQCICIIKKRPLARTHGGRTTRAEYTRARYFTRNNLITTAIFANVRDRDGGGGDTKQLLSVGNTKKRNRHEDKFTKDRTASVENKNDSGRIESTGRVNLSNVVVSRFVLGGTRFAAPKTIHGL